MFLIGNAYKLSLVLTSKNAGVAQTYVGVTYLSFMENMKTHRCALYVHHKTFAHCQNTSTFACHCLVKAKTPTVDKYDPGPHQTMKYRICDVLGVRKCASGERINNFSEKLTYHTSHFSIH